MVGCGPGSGPYSSEGQAVSGLKKYMKKECECGDARYKYFSSGQDTRVSGCESNGKKVSRVLSRYENTAELHKSSRSESLYRKLQGCFYMD